MKTTRPTGYGIYDLTRKIVRRTQRERELAETLLQSAYVVRATVIRFPSQTGNPPPSAPKAA